MIEPPADRDAAELERHARDVFQTSVDGLDAATRSRLNRSRQRALAAVIRRDPVDRRWLMLAPAAGALAAIALAAVLLLRSPSPTSAPVQVAATSTSAEASADPLDLLTAGEDLELATEADLEFYAWVELESAGDDAGDGVG